MPRSELLTDVQNRIRTLYYSKRTEEAYLYWIRQYIRYHDMRHPREMGGVEVSRFLSHLTIERNVAPYTQKVAINALMFLYRQVLGRTDLQVSEFRRSTQQQKLPVVLTRSELEQLFGLMEGIPRLCAQLMYGSGLRVMEVVRLRVPDIDFDRLSMLIRDGKGGKRMGLAVSLSRKQTNSRPAR